MKTQRGMDCNNLLNVRTWKYFPHVLWGLAGIFLMGCAARTDVKLRKQYDGESPLPRPNLILVHNFVTSADTSDTPTSTTITDEEAEVGRKILQAGQLRDVAKAKLSPEEIKALGL